VPPVVSLSKFHDPDAALGGGLWYFRDGVPSHADSTITNTNDVASNRRTITTHET
jgi:hypothetical protein